MTERKQKSKPRNSEERNSSASVLRTLERALRTLMLIAEEGRPLTAREVAHQLRIPLSTVYRYLLPLTEFGLVRRVGDDGRYTVGPKAVTLWTAFRRSFNLATHARPLMEKLCRETQETVLLTVTVGNRAMCIEAVESPLPIHYSFRPGVERPLYAGASAKALLAFLEDSQIEEVLAEARVQAPHLYASLPEAIRRIRADGYAVSESEVDPGACAVGVPIFGEGNVLEGALSVVAPVFRTNEDRLKFLVEKTVQTAREIEQNLRSPSGGRYR
ncbi:MAG: IclR family transcriptional regulator [Armatimonadota bacterium]|nr:IclR family transcriptional regulator [Armatimonadota bacterium]